MRNFLLAAVLTCAGGAASAFGGATSIVDSCSNINFLYLGSDAALGATCLRGDGTPVQSSVKIEGISNRDGILTFSGGPSTFQRTCGSIRVIAQGGDLILHARCRSLSGHSQPTSIEIKGISNQNGELQP